MKLALSKYNVNHNIFNIMVFGILFFYCGIYILPDVNDMARIFYILVMLPMLLLFLKEDKFYLKDKYFWLLMILPIYLTISHFWSNEEHITKSTSFHIRKLVYILFFVAAIFLVVRSRKFFLRLTFQCMFVAGSISAIISLLCFFSGECGVVSGRLSSFSVQDINKAGAMYTVHMAICLFFMLNGFWKDKKNTLWLNVVLILSLLLSAAAVFYAKTDATTAMFVLLAFFILVPFWSPKRIYLLVLITIGFVGTFFYFDGLAILMQDGSFKIRRLLAKESLQTIENSMIFGVGMTHKLPLLGLPHPHNIFTDVLRFGGLLGFLILLITVLILFIKGLLEVSSDNPVIKLCLAWFVASIAIMSVYAQQPITRPGGYIWFLYWMPVAILAAELSRLDRTRNDGSLRHE